MEISDHVHLHWVESMLLLMKFLASETFVSLFSVFSSIDLDYRKHIPKLFCLGVHTFASIMDDSIFATEIMVFGTVEVELSVLLLSEEMSLIVRRELTVLFNFFKLLILVRPDLIIFIATFRMCCVSSVSLDFRTFEKLWSLNVTQDLTSCPQFYDLLNPLFYILVLGNWDLKFLA